MKPHGNSTGRKGVEIGLLTNPVPIEFRQMTFPIYRQLLDLTPTTRHPEQGDQRWVKAMAIGAWKDGEPSGLILVELPLEDGPAPGILSLGDADPDERSAQLLSVYVKPSDRFQGIASALFGELENRVRELGFANLRAVYTTGKPSIAHLERIFGRYGWSSPSARSLSVRFTPETVLNSELLAAKRLRVLKRGLEIFPWSELLPQEEEMLRRSQQESPWIAPLLTPWRFDRNGFDPASVGARYRGQVVGWLIVHRAAFDVVRIACAYMRGDLSRHGRILALLSQTLEGLRESPCRFCSFVTPISYPLMVEFIRRRMAPVSDFVGETRESYKVLGGKNAECSATP